MAVVKPFSCYRPNGAAAGQVAALPYDVYSRAEAREAVKGNPLSFLNIDRPDVHFPDSVPSQDDRVYDKAKELLMERIEDGTFVYDGTPCYYIYRLTMDGRDQTGVAACCSVDDYLNFKSIEGGSGFASQNSWNRFGADAVWFPGQTSDPAHF